MTALRAALVALGITAGTWALAAEPEANPGFPTGAPVRERTLAVDDLAAWTLRKGEAAVPLTVVSTPGRTVVSLAGGWLVLGPDLEPGAATIDLLPASQPAGSPWATALGSAVVFVTGTPGSLAVLYPDPAVVVRRDLGLTDLSHFAIADQGFLFVQGRRASAALAWNRPIREVQPLPFFPGDLSAAADGTLWATDSLQARPWRQEEGFWKPLDFPKVPGRLTTLAPFPDSTGYFAGGPGWVGAFSSDGTPFWVREKDLSGRPLPRDLKLKAGAGRLYLWSAQGRKVWSWAWTREGPSGAVQAPAQDRWADLVRGEIDRLEALGSVPEAQAVAQYGADLAQSVLRAQPLSQPWTRALAEFNTRRLALKEQIVGAGVLDVFWSAPEGRPLASWTWEPDAAWADVGGWEARIRPWWEGRPFEGESFGLALSGEAESWPGVRTFAQSDLVLPSWLSVDLGPEGSSATVHWARVALPGPPIPYDLPVE